MDPKRSSSNNLVHHGNKIVGVIIIQTQEEEDWVDVETQDKRWKITTVNNHS